MRVLHVYSGNLYGGIERMLVTLVTERGAAPDMEPHFALCFDGRLAGELRTAGASAHMLGAVSLRRPWSVAAARARLRGIIRDIGCDVAICHGPWVHALFAGTIRRAAVPLAFFQHDEAGGRHWTERLARRYPPDAILSNSRFSAASIGRIFAAPPPDVVHCPVAAPVDRGPGRAAVRAALDTAHDTVVIAQVSRMEAWKGHVALIGALARLPTDVDWCCWLIGGAQRPDEARYRAGLEARVAALGLAGRVRFLGERTDVAGLLHAADVFCHPARNPEPFGVAVVEAMRAGLPVAAFAAGGLMEVVDETCGILAPPGDEAALAAALAALVRDAGLRHGLGSAAARRAHAVADPSMQLPRLARVLRQAIAGAA
jgi:glycosyltransferase involved in cell wall biosynthesis